MRYQLVRPGDSLQRVLTARNLNEMRQAADIVLRGGRGLPADRLPAKESPATTATIHNTSGVDKDDRDLVSLDTPAILPSESEGDFERRMLFAGSAPALHRFGVLLEPADQSETAKAAVSGVVRCRLFVPLNGAWIKRADFDSTDQTRVLARPNGSAQILWQDTGTDTTVDAIVRLGNPSNATYPGKVKTTAITANGTGTVTIWQLGVTTNYDITGVRLDWMHNSEQVSAGKEVLISWFPEEAVWRIIGAECEAA